MIKAYGVVYLSHSIAGENLRETVTVQEGVANLSS